MFPKQGNEIKRTSAVTQNAGVSTFMAEFGRFGDVFLPLLRVSISRNVARSRTFRKLKPRNGGDLMHLDQKRFWVDWRPVRLEVMKDGEEKEVSEKHTSESKGNRRRRTST
jgi:hypothetical protein